MDLAFWECFIKKLITSKIFLIAVYLVLNTEYFEIVASHLFIFFLSLVFAALTSFFSSCCKASLGVLNFISFCLSVKLSISPWNVNESLSGYSFLQYLPFHQRRKWQPTPIFLPEETHGQRSLMGYSP